MNGLNESVIKSNKFKSQILVMINPNRLAVDAYNTPIKSSVFQTQYLSVIVKNDHSSLKSSLKRIWCYRKILTSYRA